MKLAVLALCAALQIMQLISGRDGTTELKTSDTFTSDQQLFLATLLRKVEGKTQKQQNPHPKTNIAWASWIIARLGGWHCYTKSEGPPGPIVMGRGLKRFHEMFDGWNLYKEVICTNFTNGKRHDFRLFKESGVRIHPKIKTLTDTGYQGIGKIHSNSELPKKKTKKTPLTKQDKFKNRQLSSQRVLNENVIGMIKRFKIISDRYRNRRKRFGLRFNLIAAIYNMELGE